MDLIVIAYCTSYIWYYYIHRDVTEVIRLGAGHRAFVINVQSGRDCSGD